MVALVFCLLIMTDVLEPEAIKVGAVFVFAWELIMLILRVMIAKK
jgi:hypothetical protein